MPAVKVLATLLFTAFCTRAIAQTADTSTLIVYDTSKVPLTDVDGSLPHFKKNLLEYVAKNMQYPENERDAGIMGTVYLSFNIETDGRVTNVKVIKGVPNGPGLDAEAVRVISQMPKWTAGMRNGHPVKSLYYLPLHFLLR